ncbi:hypothetical protein [Chitinophaga rhizophila]|uniref:AhpC/TSA family protein n=1 Tax=Chitinophaga rhizophila TaxID=2866212 RepID=A0ABS7GC15_9BACT|nr:hypothetical protein [Chitinophaga rhizophila]MBW8685222.1 hypothetical protein [Chitinophaga rhizophila]
MKYKYNVNLLCLLILAATTYCACKSHANTQEPEDVVTAWIGKTISFPPSALCQELGEIVPCKSSADKKYKILVYTDSIGCVSCNLRIDEWKRFERELDSSIAQHVDFQFYFFPKKNSNLADLFKRENFRKVVHIDQEDTLNKLNDLPKDMQYQCFLLDQNDKVLLVGNPTLNTSIWDLYVKTIKK